MKELKFLFETTIQKQVEEPTKETREENGQKVEITRTVKKLKPIKVSILKPDRKLYKGAELFYAKTLSDYLKEGLLPYSLVVKRYANDGGPLTESEKERLKALKKEVQELEAQFYSLGKDKKELTPEENSALAKEKNEILVRINSINAEVGSIQNAHADIFDSTAEMKARNDTIEWWSLHLIYADLDGKGYAPLFGDVPYTERLVALEDFEDKEEAFSMELIKRMSYLVSFWFMARDTVTKLDFETMERLYLDTSSTYKVEEETSVKVVDATPTTT